MAKEKQNKNLTRRKFMDLSITGTAGIGISQVVPSSLLLTESCSSTRGKTVFGACYHDCPDTCSWKVTAVDNKITQFEANKDHPYTRGKLCNKMDNFPEDVTFHPDRLLYPMKRSGKKGEGNFERISWDQALQDVSDQLKSVIDEYGGESVLPYSFAGTQGMIQFNTMSGRFFAHIGASKLQRTICGAPSGAGTSWTMGNSLGMVPKDLPKSKYIIVWGTNPVVSNQHLWPFIQEAKKKGAKLVVIDPFLSQTAREADWHIQPIPGTDVAVALSMMQVIIAENLYDLDYVGKYTVGFQQLKSHIQKYRPQLASNITGLEKETIEQLAREYARAKPSAIRVLVGMEHQANGAAAFRAVSCLPALTGAWRNIGGGLLHYTYELFGEALNWDRLNLAESIGNPDRRQINMIRIGKALTDRSLEPPVKALFVYNSNPAVIAPNQNLVCQGLGREDLFTVVLEHFMTDTAKYADYIFPATTQLEHWDLMDSWGQTYLSLNQPAIDPQGESRSNSDFFRSLSRKMGFRESFLFESDLVIIKSALQSNHPYLKGITFNKLKEKGSIRLNIPDPWLPYAEGNFSTPSGKCEFYSKGMEELGLSPLPEYMPVQLSDDDKKNYPLQLLTLKSTKHFLNSSHANVDHFLKKEGKPYLDIHATDAEKRQILDGDEALVFNQRGEMQITARIGTRVKPGVISMPQGYWPSLLKGSSSANALTTDMLTDMGEGGAFQETRAEVRKV